MSDDGRQLHLNVNILPAGGHPAAWRAPGGNPRAFIDITQYQEVARIAERGLLDAVFLADNSFLRLSPNGGPSFALDPLVVVTAMALATERIGVIASISTTFHHPYTIARAFNSLDHLSGGRAGWNVVTTRDPLAGRNYGFTDLPDRETRYARAAEAVEVVTKLWDSWDDEGLVADPATRVFLDPSRIRTVDHLGEHFDVRGPLQLPRSPQGRPLLVQAGGSPAGRDLAASFADAVFTPQHLLAEGQAFYRDIKERAVRAGRDPERIAVLPGLNPIVGSTEEEARRRQRELNELLTDDELLRGFAGRFGIDPELLDLERPVPVELFQDTGGTYGSVGFDSATRALVESDPHLPLREVIARGGIAHRVVVGGPEQIADNIEEWFRGRAADGFNLQCDVYPGGLADFVEHVVPELQRRGLFRREYAEPTLRERYGVPVGAPVTAPADRSVGVPV